MTFKKQNQIHEREIISKEANISYDGKLFLVRIPKEISEEMNITKENKNQFKMRFELIKPNPKETGMKKILNVKLDGVDDGSETD